MITFSDTPSKRADIVLAYGDGALGKTTFALGAPDPVLLSVEGGEVPLVRRGVAKPIMLRESVNDSGVPRDWAHAGGMLTAYRDYPLTKRPGKWLVIDGLTRLWEMCVDATLASNRWKALSDPGYGKGERAAFDSFKQFTAIVLDIANQGTGIVMTAHAALVKDRMPESPTEDAQMWVPALQCMNNADAARAVANICDVRLFFTRRAMVTGVGGDARRPSKHVAVGGGEIIVRTQRGHGYLAGCRYPDVPDPIELSPDPHEAWERFWSYALESADQIRVDCEELLLRCPAEKREAATAALGAAKDLSALRAVRARLRLTVEKENGNE